MSSPIKNRLNKLLVKSNLNKAEKIFSTSEAMADQVKGLMGRAIDIEITPFGVDMNQFKSIKPIFTSSKLTIGIVKRLEHKYGIDILIESFAEVLDYYQKSDSVIASKLELLIVGDGSKSDEYLALADRLGISSSCVFKSAIPNAEVPDVISTIDLFVVCSRIESFGVAAIEASACGRPCIVTDVGGLPEVVCNKHTGIIIPSESISELTKAIIHLIDNPNIASELGENARGFVESKYSEPQVLNIMTSALSNHYMNQK